MRVYFTNAGSTSNFQQNEKIRIAGNFTTASELTNSTMINGREFTINNVTSNFIEINTTGLDFPDDNFSLAETDLYVLSDESEDVEPSLKVLIMFMKTQQLILTASALLFVKWAPGKHHYTNSNINDLKEISTFTGSVATNLGPGTPLITSTCKHNR